MWVLIANFEDPEPTRATSNQQPAISARRAVSSYFHSPLPKKASNLVDKKNHSVSQIPKEGYQYETAF